MNWGARRPLSRTAMLVRAIIRRRVATFRAGTFVALPHRHSLRRFAVTILLIAFAGGGQPFGHMLDAARDSSGQGSLFAMGGGVGSGLGRAAVTVQLPPVRSKRPRVVLPLPGDRRALIVGINHVPGAPSLQGAVTDARYVQQALLKYGFPKANITTLLEGRATRDAILRGLDSLAARTPKSGVAVVAIAAHSRRRGGINELLAADGVRIASTEIASRLRAVRSPVWIALPTCYAAGYALPGIVGHNRIATFASSSTSLSYELGDGGSYMILNMVKRAMIDGAAPFSVETAFHFAEKTLERTAPNRVPLMSDGVDGDLVLGPAPLDKVVHAAPSRPSSPAHGAGAATGGSGRQGSGGSGSQHGVVALCGRYRWNCN